MAKMETKKAGMASFRGVPFHLLDSDMEVGRRTVTHNYPLSNQPYNEDMGKKTRALNLKASILNSIPGANDYQVNANKLLQACEKSGSGVLVCPGLVVCKVVCTKCQVQYSSSGKGEAQFQLSFEEEGENSFPSAKSDLEKVMKEKSESALEDFQKAITDFLEEFLKDFNEAKDKVLATISQIAAKIRELLDKLDPTPLLQEALDFLKQLEELIKAPQKLLKDIEKTVKDFIKSVDKAIHEVLGSLQKELALEISLKLSSLQLDSILKAIEDFDLSEVKEAVQAIIDYVRRISLVVAASLSVEISFTSRLEARLSLERVLDNLDLLAHQASSKKDTSSFELLVELKTMLIASFEQKELNAKKVSKFDVPPSALPAMVLAYQLYGDITREQEILKMNPQVFHPGFLPAGTTLEVKDA